MKTFVWGILFWVVMLAPLFLSDTGFQKFSVVFIMVMLLGIGFTLAEIHELLSKQTKVKNE